MHSGFGGISRGVSRRQGRWEEQKEAVGETTEEYADISDMEAPIFDYTLWELGYSAVKVLGVKNNGTLGLKYRLDIVAKQNSTNSTISQKASG